jgi:hypothetical protein
MPFERLRGYVRRMWGTQEDDALARSLIEQFGATEAHVVAQLPDGRYMLTLRSISVPVSRALADELTRRGGSVKS